MLIAHSSNRRTHLRLFLDPVRLLIGGGSFFLTYGRTIATLIATFSICVVLYASSVRAVRLLVENLSVSVLLLLKEFLTRSVSCRLKIRIVH